MRVLERWFAVAVTGALMICALGGDSVAETLPQETLTVDLLGGGTGTVTSSPSGIACPPTCSAGFDYNTYVELTATPDPGNALDQWGGVCAPDQCALDMNGSYGVTATFELLRPGYEHTLTVSLSGTGTGTVTSTPEGISCPPTCASVFPEGTTVTLMPTPGQGAEVGQWNPCAWSSECVVKVFYDRSVTASFVLTSDTSTTVKPVKWYARSGKYFLYHARDPKLAKVKVATAVPTSDLGFDMAASEVHVIVYRWEWGSWESYTGSYEPLSSAGTAKVAPTLGRGRFKIAAYYGGGFLDGMTVARSSMGVAYVQVTR